MKRNAICIVGATLLLLEASYADEPTYPVQFRLVLERPAERVYLAGTFNEWQPRATPMQPDAERRVWTLTLHLPAGAHQYKFVVNGTEWLTDPNAPVIDDGNGNLNSVVWVEPDGYNRPAAIGDGHITRSGIRHNPNDLRDRNPVEGRLYLRLRTRKADVERVWLHYRAGKHTQRVAMTPAVSDALYTYYRAALPETNLEYWFVIEDGKARIRLPAGNAAFRHRLGEHQFEVPTWVQDAIFYQIMPDRFYNADPTNDPDPDQPIDFTGRKEGDGFYGGDLKGILHKLDYLRDLGITALYLNPVFASVTHHNYDTDDYERVDPALGTEEDLIQLAQTLRQHEMRLILDGVFNHVGVYFFAFQDLLRHQERSAFRDWFIVERFPVAVEPNPNYWAWWNIPYMPKLNHQNPAVRRYLLGVVVRWTRMLRLDGWRLDVPNEVPDVFWREFRPVVRRANPEAVIIGEIWGDAGRWLQGDMFDSVMNYLWRAAVLGFVAHGTLKPSQFDQRMAHLQVMYPRQSLYAMYNMLSSHDTPRFRRECGGDLQRVRLGLLLQFTSIGAPAIYYGDEIGMDGGGIPDNRRPMRFELSDEERALHEFVKQIIALRKAEPALRRGEWQTLLVDDAKSVYAFARYLDSPAPQTNPMVVVLNTSTQPQTVSLPVVGDAPRWRVALSTHDLEQATFPASNGRITLTLPPLTGTVLVPTNNPSQGGIAQ
ncbi:MAG: alpha amylase N-terminal ig-like domain-containing protein [Armatimonadota bacterium]|nr:alpha amylase N-terminal ig-like domain-containing protein [Armatimonadota bacterium]